MINYYIFYLIDDLKSLRFHYHHKIGLRSRNIYYINNELTDFWNLLLVNIWYCSVFFQIYQHGKNWKKKLGFCALFFQIYSYFWFYKSDIRWFWINVDYFLQKSLIRVCKNKNPHYFYGNFAKLISKKILQPNADTPFVIVKYSNQI